MEQQLRNLQLCDETYLFDLANNPLPLWEESIWNSDPKWLDLLTPISEELASSDAFIVIAPEWHGMAPSGLKNFFLMWGKGELANKPALLTAISSADGGAYTVAEMRSSSYKNNRLCYMPEQLVIRNVENVLNANKEDNTPDADQYFRDRIDYTLRVLKEYAVALKGVRDSDVVDLKTWKNGM